LWTSPQLRISTPGLCEAPLAACWSVRGSSTRTRLRHPIRTSPSQTPGDSASSLRPSRSPQARPCSADRLNPRGVMASGLAWLHGEFLNLASIRTFQAVSPGQKLICEVLPFEAWGKVILIDDVVPFEDCPGLVPRHLPPRSLVGPDATGTSVQSCSNTSRSFTDRTSSEKGLWRKCTPSSSTPWWAMTLAV